MIHSTVDAVTDMGAIAAIVSPWWLPWLTSAHEAAAWILPFMGVAWIALQMFYKIKDRK